MFGGPACAFFKRLSNRIHYHILFSVRDDHDKGKDIEVMSLTTIVVAANALMLARSLWTLGIIARQGKAFSAISTTTPKAMRCAMPWS